MVCDKISYPEYKDAREAISGLVAKKKGSFKVYKCKDCKLFHVTTITHKSLKPVKEKYKTVNAPPESNSVPFSSAVYQQLIHA